MKTISKSNMSLSTEEDKDSSSDSEGEQVVDLAPN